MIDAIRDLLTISMKSTDIAFAASRIREIGADTARKNGLIPLRAFLVRSVTVEPFLPHLIVYGALAGFWLDITVGGYGSYIDELMNPDSTLKQNEPDVVLFLSDVEDLVGGLREASASGDHAAIQKALDVAQSDVRNLLGQFRSHCTARILVQGLVIPDEPALGEVTDANLGGGEVWAVQQLNTALAVECRKIGDAVFFDHDQVASRFGRVRWRDHRMFHANRLALAIDAFAPFAEGLARALRTLYFPPKKVLCTDLDDTLWGGIIGEDGVDGIATGSVFPGICYLEYQRYLKQLASRGILLAIASKNNEADVIEAFDRRANDMALTLQDFAARRIGWQDKISCLPEMAQELSLGLDAFVFVDDNPVECAAMRQQLPQVTVIHVDRERPWERANQISRLGLFDSLIITDDDRNRSAEYKAQTQRADLEATSISREDFLASLNIVCTVLDAQDAPLSRTEN